MITSLLITAVLWRDYWSRRYPS